MAFSLWTALLAPALVAQGTPPPQQPVPVEFHHRKGGEVVGVWVEPHPTVADHFVLFTAEGGPRIRRLVVEVDRSDSTVPAQVSVAESRSDFMEWTGSEDPHALHDLWIKHDLGMGFAVGTDGAMYCATDLGQSTLPDPHWMRMTTPSTLTNDAHLWAVEWFPHPMDENNPTAGVGFLAGEGDVLLKFSGGSWAAESVLPTLTGSEFRHFVCLAFSSDGENAVAGAHMPALAGASVGGIFHLDDDGTWKPAQVERPAGFPSGPFAPEDAYLADIAIWSIDFSPTDPELAFAVGGHRLGNGPGYVFRSENGGKSWAATYPCNHPLPGGLCQSSQCCYPADYASCGNCLSPTELTCAPDLVPLCANQCGTDSTAQECAGIFKHAGFATHYGVTVLSDGSAVAVTYGGGVDYYDPALGVWSDMADTTAHESGPLWGIHSGAGADEVFLSGLFGELRHFDAQWAAARLALEPHTYDRSDLAGIMTELADGRNWRLQDLAFASDTVGWIVGQATIARTEDGGVTWEQELLDRVPNAGSWLRTVAALDEDRAVAAGDPKLNFTTPTVYYYLGSNPPTDPCTQSECRWALVGAANLPSNAGTLKTRDVAVRTPAAGAPEFWICTDKRFLWVSDSTASPPESRWLSVSLISDTSFEASAIAFAPAGDHGFVVGQSGSPAVPAAYRLDFTGGSPVAVDVSPSGGGRLRGVSVSNGSAYAVGLAGTVLVYDSGAGQFVTAAGASGGITTRDLASVAVTQDDQSVEHVFVGGRHGVVFRHVADDPGTWELLQSKTVDFVRGMSFRSATQGWICGFSAPQATPLPPQTPDGWGDSAVLEYTYRSSE